MSRLPASHHVIFVSIFRLELLNCQYMKFGDPTRWSTRPPTQTIVGDATCKCLGGSSRCSWEVLRDAGRYWELGMRTLKTKPGPYMGIHRHLWVDHDSTPGSLACQNTILGIGRQRMALAGQAVVQNGKWFSAWCLANARKDRRTWKCSVSGAATSGLPKVYPKRSALTCGKPRL